MLDTQVLCDRLWQEVSDVHSVTIAYKFASAGVLAGCRPPLCVIRQQRRHGGVGLARRRLTSHL